MPIIHIDDEERERWEDRLVDSYENEPPRTGIHVSDLLMCLRQAPLLEKYTPVWTPLTLFRFTMGRALEKAFFKLIAFDTTAELEVRQDGLEGHIDFGADPLDYECKATWGKPPEEPEDLFESKHWWFDQMAAYAYIRGRLQARLVVLWAGFMPQLESYLIEWSKEELASRWRVLLDRKDYVLAKKMKKELPIKTPLTWLCKGCPVKEVCYANED